jgi:hypothetical protein
LLKIKGRANDAKRFANEGRRVGGVVWTGGAVAQLHGEYYHKDSYRVQYFNRLLKGKGIGLDEARSHPLDPSFLARPYPSVGPADRWNPWTTTPIPVGVIGEMNYVEIPV